MNIQDRFNNFYIQYHNQGSVGDTPENKGQCVGLIEVWTDFLGLPHTWGNADDLFNNANPSFFEKIINTPTAMPQTGDIIVWTHDFNGSVGHTGVATGANTDLDKLEVFEQNDPIGSVCHTKEYNYAYIQGWLRPILPPEPVPTPPSLTDDQSKTLQVAQDAHVRHPEFQQLEAFERDLVERYEHPVFTPAPPVITTVLTEPTFNSSFGKLLYSWAKSVG